MLMARYVDKKCRQLLLHAEGTGGMAELKQQLQPGTVCFGGFRVYVQLFFRFCVAMCALAALVLKVHMLCRYGVVGGTLRSKIVCIFFCSPTTNMMMRAT